MMSNDSRLETTEFSLSEQINAVEEQLGRSDYAAALETLELLLPVTRTPILLSAHALCVAEVKGSFKAAVNACHEAIKKDPKNPEHYYRQGRILLLAGRKKDAIWVLRMGLRHGRSKGIIDLLGSLGIRRTPPIQFLQRSNPLNKFLGILLARLNLR